MLLDILKVSKQVSRSDFFFNETFHFETMCASGYQMILTTEFYCS